MTLGHRTMALTLIAAFVVMSVFISSSVALRASAATAATLSVDAGTVTGTVNTTLTTQIVWPTIPGTPNAQARLNTLAPKMVRIHAGTDGGFDNVVLPFNVAGKVLEGGGTKQPWDFTMMDLMVNEVKAAGTTPVMNVRYAPDPMYTCTGTFGDPGTLRDQTYGVFSDYMANLVRYYNLGSFAMPQGGTKTNPAGTANKITWWEIWNEPDYPWENPCTGDGTNPIVNPTQYAALWNATAAKMKAVDPTIKLVGPAPSNHPSLVSGTLHDSTDYIPTLLRTATIKPDAISFHGYGGWDNAQGDRLLFDGNGGGGIKADIDGLADIKSWIAQYAPGTPVWLTETNVSADPGLDPAQRAWNQFSAAWGASLFRAMVVGGLSVIHQFQFLESKQLGLIDDTTGAPLLPYWRDYYLSRYFPVGSPILLSTPSAGAPEVEILAAREPGGSNVRVLVIDRQVVTGQKGIGAPVTVTLNMQNFAGLQAVTMRMLDVNTLATLATGPALVAMPTSSTQTIAFGGYGAALLEFCSAAAQCGTPTQSAPPTPTATPIATPTPTTSTSASPTPPPSPTGSSSASPSATPSASPTGSASPSPTPPPAPSGPPSSVVYMPNLTKTLGGDDGWDTPFIVQNIGTASTDLQIDFYRFSDGGLIDRRFISQLPPGSSYADVPKADPDLPDDTQFSLIVRSFGGPVATVINQAQGSGDRMQAAAYVGTTTGATTLYLPNVTRRFFGYDTPFIVQNLGGVPTTVTATFTSFDGTLHFATTLFVLPGRSGVVDPDFTPGLVDGTQYSVVLRADQPISAIVNAHNETGSPVAFTTTGVAAGGHTLYAPYAVKTDANGGLNSPVVVQNLGVIPTDATLEFTPLGGGSTQIFTLTGIVPGSSKVFDPRFFLGTTTLCHGASATCLGQGEYSLRITAAQEVTAVVLPTSAATSDAYAATASAGSRVYLPNVTRTLGGALGWTTPIALQSAGATSATLRWYRFSDALLVRTQTVTMPSNGAVWLDPRTVAGLADDTQYSVVIDGGSGGAVTAIVYEHFLGAGDGVMIYGGVTE